AGARPAWIRGALIGGNAAGCMSQAPRRAGVCWPDVSLASRAHQGSRRRLQSGRAFRTRAAPGRGRRLAERAAGRSRAASANLRHRRTRAQRDHPQRFARHRVRAGDESVSRLRARLHLLFRASLAQLLEPFAGTGLRNQAAREDEPRRGAARGIVQTRLRAEAHQYRQQHRSVPAGRETVATDARRAGSAGRMPPPLHDRHQERAGRTRPRHSCADGARKSGAGVRIGEFARQPAGVEAGTARVRTAPAPAGGAGARASGRSGRRAGRADHPGVERSRHGSGAGTRRASGRQHGRLHGAAPAVGIENPVPRMAGDPRAAARRTRDEPGAADEWRPGLRLRFPHPHARSGPVRGFVAAAFRSRLPQARLRPRAHAATGLFVLRAAAQDITARRIVLTLACAQCVVVAARYFPNQSSVRRMMSSSSPWSAMWWPWLAYTTSVVGTPSVFSACQYSNDCGAGHSSSRSPTTISAGVCAFLMKLIAELFAYAAGSSYSDAPKNGIIHWSIWFWP